MYITWYPNVGEAEIIADDSLPAGPGSRKLLDAWPQHSQMVQTSPTVRGANVVNWGRSNLSLVYNIRTRVEFSTVDECMIYRDELMGKLKGRGYLELGYNSSYRTVTGAVCTNVSYSERYGVTTVVELQFVAESIS